MQYLFNGCFILHTVQIEFFHFKVFGKHSEFFRVFGLTKIPLFIIRPLLYQVVVLYWSCQSCAHDKHSRTRYNIIIVRQLCVRINAGGRVKLKKMYRLSFNHGEIESDSGSR